MPQVQSTPQRFKMRSLRTVACPIVMTAAAMLVPAPPLTAQVTTATLFGIVRDTTGAIVPGASITATNEGTGITRTSVTDDGGEFTLAALPAGAYTLRIELQGFKTSTRSGLQLGPGQTSRQTFEIEIGTLEESVTVQAAAPLVETAAS